MTASRSTSESSAGDGVELSPRTGLAAGAPRVRGRLAGVAALALFLALQLAAGEWLFSGIRVAWLDACARWMPRELIENPVVIVAVDDASLAAVGQWPWPRQRIAELIAEILRGNPLALGIDILWLEPDRSSPRQWAQQAGPLPASLREQLLALPDHDEALSAALRGGPIVVGIAGVRGGGGEVGGPLAPVRIVGAVPGWDPALALPAHDGMLRSLRPLDRGAQGHGLLSVDRDPDGVIRRVPLLSSVAGRLAPGFAVEVLRLAAGAPSIDLHLEDGAVRAVAVGPLSIATEADGTLPVHYTPHDPRRFVAASDVLARRVPADLFDQRLVLLGVTGLGLADLPLTPVGPMPGIEIHAQLLENVLAGRSPRRPAWASAVEAALSAGFALLLVAALPTLRLRWHLPALALTLALLGCVGIGTYRGALWLLDAATPALGQSFVFVALLGGTLAETRAQRRRLRRELELERLGSARIEGELAAAHRIQMGILPAAASLAPDPRFDLEASLTPARQVGGDLYDFFLIDADHLLLAIGDVSGKGVPASLFMALAKAFLESSALRGGDTEIGEVVRRADREISRENPEAMFVTLFAGILDLATGELRFCNAGHDDPFIARAGAPARRLTSVGGPPLCVVDAFPYATESHRLAPGEILCLVTDGVTEAANRAGEMLGADRTAAALGDLPAGSTAADAIARARRAVDGFLAGADPSDDVTLLAVRWTGTAESARGEAPNEP